MMKKFRSKYFTLVLYPTEDISHANALDYITQHYNYCYITHDNDLDDNNNLKKSHVHVVISFDNYRWNSSLSDELNIQVNYIQAVNNLENILKYLIHYNDETKFQYDIELVQGPLKSKLIKYLKQNSIKSESSEVKLIIEILESLNKYTSYLEFLKIICDNELYSTFRRNASFFSKILDEINRNLL